MSAIPTGSFAPDSPSRIVPVRPLISRLPSTENITAGSVGASAAPRTPAIVQSKPKKAWAKAAITAAVANVPMTPSTVIGNAAPRKRRQPTCMPPSKRITISATTPIRSTLWIEITVSRPGKTSDATAATTRKSAGAGTGNRSVSLYVPSAPKNPAATTRTIVPNSWSSLTGRTLEKGLLPLWTPWGRPFTLFLRSVQGAHNRGSDTSSRYEDPPRPLGVRCACPPGARLGDFARRRRRHLVGEERRRRDLRRGPRHDHCRLRQVPSLHHRPVAGRRGSGGRERRRIAQGRQRHARHLLGHGHPLPARRRPLQDQGLRLRDRPRRHRQGLGPDPGLRLEHRDVLRQRRRFPPPAERARSLHPRHDVGARSRAAWHPEGMVAAAQNVLVVEDEASIASFVSLYLKNAGYTVRTASTGSEALSQLQGGDVALTVIDLRLPDLDGIEVCRRIRKTSDMPILMLTARDEDVDKIIGLEVGADDYMTKPFNPRELVARVKSILRRSVPAREARESAQIRHGDLHIDAGRREVRVGEEEVQLAPKEFDLLWELLDHRGLVLTRDQLLERVWGYTFAGDTRTVDVHVRQLRRKLGDASPIVTVWGVGYKVSPARETDTVTA